MINLFFLIAKAVQESQSAPSPYRAEFLREQVCNVPVGGQVLIRSFVGV